MQFLKYFTAFSLFEGNSDHVGFLNTQVIKEDKQSYISFAPLIKKKPVHNPLCYSKMLRRMPITTLRHSQKCFICSLVVIVLETIIFFSRRCFVDAVLIGVFSSTTMVQA